MASAPRSSVLPEPTQDLQRQEAQMRHGANSEDSEKLSWLNGFLWLFAIPLSSVVKRVRLFRSACINLR
jgi:ferric-dicitrate binding protein FerR (iron transport regulator)